MRYFLDCLFLIGCSFGALFFIPADKAFLVAFLCALILLCGSYVLPAGKCRLILCLLFGCLTAVDPAVYLFYPVFMYILFHEKYRALAAVFVLQFCWFVPGKWEMGTFFAFAGLLGSILAGLLEKNSRTCMELERELRCQRDDSREHSLLLAQKNKALLEKQDYEIYNATLKERNRIAREIHDNVGHVLSRSILLVGALKAINKDAGLSSLLQKLEDSLNAAMNSIRSSVHDLHDEAVNLEEAERGMAKEFAFCPVELQYDMSRNIPREVKYCFISITKEALANVMRHSNATMVSITLREHPALYQLCIEDNGTRLDLEEKKEGIGIVNMRERVMALKGTLQISKEKGFRIFITIPKRDR